MPAINADTAKAWQEIANTLAVARPGVGRFVRSLTARGQAKGRSGVVIRHERDPFAVDAWRYGNEASMHMREMAGTYGFRVLVRDASGRTFWVSADRVALDTAPASG